MLPLTSFARRLQENAISKTSLSNWKVLEGMRKTYGHIFAYWSHEVMLSLNFFEVFHDLAEWTEELIMLVVKCPAVSCHGAIKALRSETTCV